jgi:TBCC domain-containing protein 1
VAHHFNAACGFVVEDLSKIPAESRSDGFAKLTANEVDRLGYLLSVVPNSENPTAFEAARDGCLPDIPVGSAGRRRGGGLSLSRACGFFAENGDRAVAPTAALREWVVARLIGVRARAARSARFDSRDARLASEGKRFRASDDDARVIENVKKGTVVRRPFDFLEEGGDRNASNDVSLRVADCEDAVVYLLAAVDFVSVVGCTDCVVVVGAASRAVRVERCRGVTLIAACRRLRVRNAARCTFHLGVVERPIFIGECRGNKVAPYNSFYESLEAHLEIARLDARRCTAWNAPRRVAAPEDVDAGAGAGASNGFSESETNHSAVSILRPELFAPFIVPFRGPSSVSDAGPTTSGPATQANPFATPAEYVAALDSKVSAVANLRNALREARLDETTKRELQATIQAYFKEWLRTSGSMRQVYELARIERGESSS